MNKIIVGLASIPIRENSLKVVIKSLQEQSLPINQYYIYLNGYSEIPYYFHSLYNIDKYTFFLSSEFGDKGDAGKFFKVGEEDGYYFGCDDDIYYPPNYIEKMISGVEKYNRKKIVSLHGSILKQPVNNFYTDRKLFNFKRELLQDTNVHVAGTGVSCFHTDTLKLSINDFPIKNQADIQFSLAAQKQGVGIVCLKHKKGFVRQQPNTVSDSIFQNHVRDEKKVKQISNLINSIVEWNIY